jgi:putative tributyrin esterase
MQAPTVLTQTWHSEALGRKKSVSVVLPPSYTTTGSPFPVAYLLHGFGGNRRTWLSCRDLPGLAAAARTILVLPESGRYWMINDAAGRRYEDYLMDEVINYVDDRFNTVASRSGRAMAGFSMGGASALFLALRHSRRVSVVASNSGAFEAPLREGDPYRAWRSDGGLVMPTVEEHERVWGAAGSAVREAYNPSRLLDARDLEALPHVYLDVGVHDYPRMIAMNRRMDDALSARAIPHEYRERPGGHDWQFVNAGLPQVFGFIKEHLARE